MAAPRAYWTGQLRLSLVSIPVKLFTATSTEKKIELHQIHEPSGKRIRYQKIAPGVGAVEAEDITRGFEYEKGKYVLLEQDEIDDLKLESKQTVELVRFVDNADIDPRYFEKPYYVLPDGDLAGEGYAVMQAALKQAKKVGIGQFILRGQSHIVAVKPCGKGLLLEVLRHAHEVRKADSFFKEISEVEVDKEALDLALELIKRKSGKFEPEMFKDQYTEAVNELIRAKIEHRDPEIVEDEPTGAKIINIMDALKKSVQQNKKGAASPKGAGSGRKAASSGKSLRAKPKPTRARKSA